MSLQQGRIEGSRDHDVGSVMLFNCLPANIRVSKGCGEELKLIAWTAPQQVRLKLLERHSSVAEIHWLVCDPLFYMQLHAARSSPCMACTIQPA